jgi:hypothetical protein
VGHPPLTTSAEEVEEEVETGGDDGDGDGASAAEASAEVVAEVGQAAEVVAAAVDHPEKLALQRPSCRHSTANLRRSE